MFLWTSLLTDVYFICCKLHLYYKRSISSISCPQSEWPCQNMDVKSTGFLLQLCWDNHEYKGTKPYLHDQAEFSFGKSHTLKQQLCLPIL